MMNQQQCRRVWAVLTGALTGGLMSQADSDRPNILLAIADDWGVHAGAYGDAVVKTPVFNRIARQGILFEKAYVSSPSCSPSRAAILSGQQFWRLGSASCLWGSIPADVSFYTDFLKQAGYAVGYERKGWAPGTPADRPGKLLNPAGEKYEDFKTFMEQKPKDKPFCFWFGSHDPHRGYKKGSGVASGIPAGRITVPACFPDAPEVRNDVADYYFEVQRFDRETGERIELLRQLGELENTIIVITSDHGMPFPRAKANLYDDGVRVPLAVCWPGHFEGGFRVTDFVSLTDLAPTFLEVAGVPVPDVMTGKSLLPQLTAGRSGRIDPKRDYVVFGRERHVAAQEAPESGGYPQRAIRTDRFLLVHNLEPNLWPAGTPDTEKAYFKGSWYADCDPGPTKRYMIANKDKDSTHQHLYDLAFSKRPEFELYDVVRDPVEQNNVASNPEYAKAFEQLQSQLDGNLRAGGDPRSFGHGDSLDGHPYTGDILLSTGRYRKQNPTDPTAVNSEK